MVIFHWITQSLVLAGFLQLAITAPTPLRGEKPRLPVVRGSPATTAEFNLTARAPAKRRCNKGGVPPCICNDDLSLRLENIRPNCPKQSFKFVNAAATSEDGTLALLPDPNATDDKEVQCDHMVELQFISKKIQANPAICQHFLSSAGTADYKSFFNDINSTPRLVFLENRVNLVKGILFKGASFGTETTVKDADGAISYLTLVKGDAKASATAIKQNMDSIMTKTGQSGFDANFVSEYIEELDAAVKKSQEAIDEGILLPAQSDGGFINESERTAARAKCNRPLTRSFWMEARDFMVRAATGKAPATDKTQCPPPPTSPSSKAATNGTAQTTAAASKIVKPSATKAATKASVTSSSVAKQSKSKAAKLPTQSVKKATTSVKSKQTPTKAVFKAPSKVPAKVPAEVPAKVPAKPAKVPAKPAKVPAKPAKPAKGPAKRPVAPPSVSKN